jgi:hypothetical protein
MPRGSARLNAAFDLDYLSKKSDGTNVGFAIELCGSFSAPIFSLMAGTLPGLRSWAFYTMQKVLV